MVHSFFHFSFCFSSKEMCFVNKTRNLSSSRTILLLSSSSLLFSSSASSSLTYWCTNNHSPVSLTKHYWHVNINNNSCHKILHSLQRFPKRTNNIITTRMTPNVSFARSNTNSNKIGIDGSSLQRRRCSRRLMERAMIIQNRQQEQQSEDTNTNKILASSSSSSSSKTNKKKRIAATSSTTRSMTTMTSKKQNESAVALSTTTTNSTKTTTTRRRRKMKMIDGDNETTTRTITAKSPTKRQQILLLSETNDESSNKNSNTTPTENSTNTTTATNCLPRTLEMKQLQYPGTTYVIGIDEAGRGPLAGPVVAAAVIIPDTMDMFQQSTLLSSSSSLSCISGIVDSKKITKEQTRLELYQQIINLPNIVWAVCIIDNTIIDQINILQATLLGMKIATATVINGTGTKDDENTITPPPPTTTKTAATTTTEGKTECDNDNNNNGTSVDITTDSFSAIEINNIPVFDYKDETHPLSHHHYHHHVHGNISVDENRTTNNNNHPDNTSIGTESASNNNNNSNNNPNAGTLVTSYVLFGCNKNGMPILKNDYVPLDPTTCYAFIDGNQKPKTILCPSQPIVKGDSKEYIIAVASILAKVTRDEIMNTIYDKQYPNYNFYQHKGYPTKDHICKIQQYGITPIHRTTFAPIKYMKDDQQNKIK